MKTEEVRKLERERAQLISTLIDATDSLALTGKDAMTVEAARKLLAKLAA